MIRQKELSGKITEICQNLRQGRENTIDRHKTKSEDETPDRHDREWMSCFEI